MREDSDDLVLGDSNAEPSRCEVTVLDYQHHQATIINIWNLEEGDRSIFNLELKARKRAPPHSFISPLNLHKLGFVWSSSPLGYKLGFCLWKNS